MRGMIRATCVAALAACHGGGGGGDDDGGPLHTTPVVADDHIAIAEDGRFDVAEIEANDTKGECPQLALGTPAHGTFANGAYIADPGFHGTDTFTYQIKSCYAGLVSGTATVSVDVASDGIPFEQGVYVDGAVLADIATGDIDGDGRADIVGVDTERSNVVVLLNRTTAAGQYAFAVQRFEGGHGPVAVAVADLDGDGRVDIATAAGTDGIVVLRNITVAGSALAFDAPSYLAAGDASGLVAADLDGDGRMDLASIDRAGDTLDIRLNTSTSGALAFGARTSFATRPGPARLRAVDADGAGGMDLAVLSIAPYSYSDMNGEGTFSLFVNATAAGATVPAFAARVDRATGDEPTDMFVADLDGDGRPEIGVLDDGLWVYANQGAGGGAPSYEAARVLAVGGSIAAPMQLDGQGGIDLLVGDPRAFTQPLTALVNKTTTAAGFAFDAHPSHIGLAAHEALSSAQPTAIRFAELDGAAPGEVVVSTTGGTYVMFGD